MVEHLVVVEADLGRAAAVRALRISLETGERVRESFPMFLAKVVGSIVIAARRRKTLRPVSEHPRQEAECRN